MNTATTSVIKLTREVEAIQIPSGQSAALAAETPVIITQSLGGSYTVVVEGRAGLYRIANKDADSLGKAHEVVQAPAAAPAADGQVAETQIWEQLKTCYDPEIPVNIVDLGLIYSLEIKPAAEGKPGSHVEVKMTLTAPGCGMGPAIAADARSKILTLPGVADAQVDVVWDPPWSPERISPDGKAKLGMV
jgi:probable FeS assembly SUF system protein SufT